MIKDPRNCAKGFATLSALIFAVYMISLISRVQSSTGGLLFLFLPLYVAAVAFYIYGYVWSIVIILNIFQSRIAGSNSKQNESIETPAKLPIAVAIALIATVLLSAHILSSYKERMAKTANSSTEISNIYNSTFASHDNSVLKEIASNVNTPSDILTELAEISPWKRVGYYESYRDLVRNDWTSIRKRVLTNPNAPPSFVNKYKIKPKKKTEK